MSETVQQALRRGTAVLGTVGLPTPDTDARWLLAAALGIEPGRVFLSLHDPLQPSAASAFDAMLQARQSGKPVSQIIGKRLFYGRSFAIDDQVLDPRPETETLIEIACREPFHRVLDLGTGSGAIAVTLLAERPTTTGVATDVSPGALDVAKRNAFNLKVDARLEVILSDWFKALTGQFDLIVSNPPYITDEAFAALDPEVRDWEPKIALTPGGDGLGPYREICRRAPEFIQENGRLLVEIGFDQGAQVQALFHTAGFADVAVHLDLNGKDRVVSGRWPGDIAANSVDSDPNTP